MSQELPPPLPTDSPKSTIKRRRRFFSWKNVLIVLAVGAAGLVWWSRDEPPPDVSDLVFTPLQLPADQNAYSVITKAAQLVPEHKWTDDEQDTLQSMIEGGNSWSDSIAQTCLRDIEPAWPLLYQAQKIPQGQTPWVSAPEDLLPELGPIKKLCNITQIRARNQARLNDPDEALRTALVVLSAGNRVEESRGTIIHYLTGSVIKRSSLVTIQDVVAYNNPSGETLRTTLRGVSESRANTDAVALAFKSELRFFDSSLPLLKGQKLGDLTDGKFRLLNKLSSVPLLLKPNLTQRVYTNYLRVSSGLVDQPLAVLQSSDELNNFTQKNIRRKFFYNPDNILGRIFLSIITPATSAILKARLREQSHISATEAFLALTLYKREHGEFPATLDALVPAYLPAVPRDYLDGAPIRYSRDLGVVWSVGLKNFAITQTDQVIEKGETVLYLTPRTPAPASRLF